ncbi:MAG: hypothetical protein JWM11_4265 [Planctomycetaceae bacterium]|nr:hypothetical protein [Planctomycetaceae bacterium]
MQFDAATIERMVRDVLRQIQPASSSPPLSSPASPNSTLLLSVPDKQVEVTRRTEQPIVTPRIVLADRIITADLLKEKAKPASQLIIGPKSIITPAAQDFLRLNRINWERGPTTPAADSIPSVGWRILISSANEPIKKAIAALCQQRTQIKHELVGTATEAATAVVTAMSRGEVPGMIVVTAAAHAVACRVNRQASIRAAAVSDLKSWNAAETSLHPNVVCVDPSERSFMELQNLLNRIVSQAPGADPPLIEIT